MPPRRRTELTEAELAAEERKSEVIGRVQALDQEGIKEYLYELCSRWQLQFPNRTYGQIVNTAFENFRVTTDGDVDMDADGHYGLRELDSEICTHEMEAIAVYHHLRHHNLIGDVAQNGDAAELLNKSLKLLEMVYYAKRIVLSVFQAKLAVHQVHCAELTLGDDWDARLGSWSLRFRWIDGGDMNETQEALLFLLDCAFEKKLRKQEGVVFEPVMVDGQHNTHAYRRVSDIKEWVYSMTQKELQWKQWVNLTHNNSVMKTVIEYLTNCNDFQFPNLVKCRDVFSFKNGIYLASEDRFHEYSNPEPLADSIVACKYFDMQFDLYEELLDWTLIPTPHLQSILDYQRLPDQACRWMYIFIGRLLYDLNEHDGWQVIPYVKGHAGTGKSTILTHVVKNFYDAIDVGILSNNIEVKFGLSAFYNKLVFIGPECRHDMAIEQAEFQSIVSGESVQVAIKRQTAISVDWKVPGILAGNEVPSWADAAGSIQRRLPVFDFEVPVVNGDMRLGKKLEEELPDILVKCNRAYRHMAAEHGSENVWNLLGDYFKKTSSELAQSINALEAYLSSDQVQYGADKAIPFDQFKFGLTSFMQNNRFERVRFSADYFRGPFTLRNIRKERCTRVWMGKEITKEFLLGIDIVEQDHGNALG